MNTCEAPNCNKSMEGKRANAKYCSPKCKADAQRARDGQKAVFGFSGVAPSPTPLSNPSIPMSNGNEFLLQERIKELQKEKQDLQADLKDERKKYEGVKDELNELKRTHDMSMLENDKTKGLNGIMNNPEALDKLTTLAVPVLQGLMQGMQGGQAQQMQGLPADLKSQQAAVQFAQWFSQQEEEMQGKVWQMIEAVSNMAIDQAKEAINQFIQTYSNEQNNANYG